MHQNENARLIAAGIDDVLSTHLRWSWAPGVRDQVVVNEYCRSNACDDDRTSNQEPHSTYDFTTNGTDDCHTLHRPSSGL